MRQERQLYAIIWLQYFGYNTLPGLGYHLLYSMTTLKKRRMVSGTLSGRPVADHRYYQIRQSPRLLLANLEPYNYVCSETIWIRNNEPQRSRRKQPIRTPHISWEYSCTQHDDASLKTQKQKNDRLAHKQFKLSPLPAIRQHNTKTKTIRCDLFTPRPSPVYTKKKNIGKERKSPPLILRPSTPMIFTLLFYSLPSPFASIS